MRPTTEQLKAALAANNLFASRDEAERSRGRRADFSGQDLSGVSFTALAKELTGNPWIYLGLASFRGANLKGADLSQCDVSNCDFEGADLEGAKLVDAHLNGASFVKARLVGADLSLARAYDCRWTDAELTGLTLEKTKGCPELRKLLKAPKKQKDEGAELREAAVRFAREAAQRTRLDGLAADDAEALAEAADDLWAHQGIHDFESEVAGDDYERVMGQLESLKISSVYREAAIAVLKERLEGGGPKRKAKKES